MLRIIMKIASAIYFLPVADVFGLKVLPNAHNLKVTIKEKNDN
jgi:hypothetical protein